MKLYFRPLLTAVPALFAAGTALADVSAKDVWDSYKAQLEVGGSTVNATENQSGDTLTISDLSMTGPTSEVNFSFKMADVVFREVGDGTVEIVLDPEYPMDLSVTAPEGNFAATVLMTSRGMSMIASGDPDNIKYDFTADELTVSVDGATADGEDLPLTGLFALKQTSGNFTVDSTAGVSFVADMIAASMDVSFEAANPENAGETFKITGTASDVTLSETGVFPEGVDMENLGAAIAAGFKVMGVVRSGAANYSFEVTGPDSVAGTFAGDSSTFDFSVSDAGLRYQAAASGIDLALNSPAMPPFALQLEDYAFGVNMPVAKSETPQDIGLLVRLAGLTVGEEIWGQFDPGQVLPRDPATFILDVSGKGYWTADVFDPTAMEAIDSFPAQMESLDINRIQVTAAGLDVSGTGALTFDNATTAMGMPPMPLGKIDLVATGVNDFLDNLVAMGILSQEDVFGAKMMIGMYAKPGAAPDSLETTVEMTPGGGLTVNGMPLQ